MERNVLRLLVTLVVAACVVGCASDEEVPESAAQATEMSLAEAILDADEQQVRRIIENNPGLVYKPNAVGETPLHYAAQVGDIAIIRYLIEKGADIRAKNDSEEVPAQVAANNGASQEVIQMLLGNAPPGG